MASTGDSNVITAQQKRKAAASMVSTHGASPTKEAVTAAPATAVQAPGPVPRRGDANVINSLKQIPATTATMRAKSQWGEWNVTARTIGMPIAAVTMRFMRY